MKKKIMVLFLSLILVLSMVSCEKEIAKKELILATTTSTENSGLLAEILPVFEEKYGMEVSVVAVGTGAALQMGVDGEVDALLVHAKSSEEKFVSDGDGLYRKDVMYNDFVIIGPSSDPANLKEVGPNVLEAFKTIAKTESTFVSRGDDSGTHKKEKTLWENIPEADWYVSAGQGMGAVISMTNEMQAYTMTDRATYLSMKDNLDLEIVLEGDSILFNQYGVIPVNPNKNDSINNEGAELFVKWIVSDEAQELINKFGVEKFGQALFISNAE